MTSLRKAFGDLEKKMRGLKGGGGADQGQLDQLNEELCAKGKAYRKRRMAAGEKSSAYLSGRAVKVCKGQISGRKKKKVFKIVPGIYFWLLLFFKSK